MMNVIALYISRAEVGKLSLWAKSNLLLVLVNKTLLAHRYAQLFMYCLWLFSGYIWLVKLKIFIIWSFTENICRPVFRAHCFGLLNICRKSLHHEVHQDCEVTYFLEGVHKKPSWNPCLAEV